MASLRILHIYSHTVDRPWLVAVSHDTVRMVTALYSVIRSSSCLCRQFTIACYLHKLGWSRWTPAVWWWLVAVVRVVVMLYCCCAVVKRSAVTIWLLLTTGTDRGGMELIPTDGSQLRHACGNKRRGEFFLQWLMIIAEDIYLRERIDCMMF